MVVDFAKDRGIQDLSNISHQVQRGDISSVLRSYEQDIRQPIKNIVAGNDYLTDFLGDIIRSLLIQLQKTKVDGELAMSALDRLLKANELNFALLAVIPTFMVVGVMFRFVWDKMKRRDIMVVSHSSTMIRHVLRY
jgi:nuclear-control-of-ATPase protein 2